MGLDVALEGFDDEGVTYHSVVTTQHGTSDGVVVLGAHFDSVDNPGADDNATGTALVIEPAQVLSQFPRATTRPTPITTSPQTRSTLLAPGQGALTHQVDSGAGVLVGNEPIARMQPIGRKGHSSGGVLVPTGWGSRSGTSPLPDHRPTPMGKSHHSIGRNPAPWKNPHSPQQMKAISLLKRSTKRTVLIDRNGPLRTLS
jgi:hypothetical protein